MKRYATILLIPLLAGLVVMPAAAVTVDEVLDVQEEFAGLEELERAAKQNGGIVRYGSELSEGLKVLLDTGSGELRSVVLRAARSGALVLMVLMFCGTADTVQSTLGNCSVSVTPLAGALAVAVIAAADVHSLLGLGRSAIGNLTSFANVLLPTAAAVTAATGAITGAAARQVAAVFFCDLLVNLIDRLLVPLLYGYIALSVSHAALGNEGLLRMANLLKWVVTTVLTVTMLAFVSYLSLSGVVAGGADAATVKAAKFTISSTIPVVGGILSDAAETILASAGILKGTVGVFGALTLLGICLIPLLQMAVHYLMYKLVSALSAVFCAGSTATLVEKIGGAFGLLMGMTGACCLLLLVALVSTVSVVAL